MRQHIRSNPPAPVSDPNSHPRGIVIQRRDGIRAEDTPRLTREAKPDMWLVPSEVGRFRGDGDGHRLTVHAVLHRRAEGVLEQLRDDVLEVHGDEGEGGVGGAVDDPLGTDAVVELADIGYEAAAAVDGGGGAEGRVDDADVAGVFGAGGRAGARVEVGGRAEVEGYVLFSDEAGADAGAQVLIEEAGYLGGGDVFAAFEEAAGEDGDGVGVGLD